MKLLTQGPLTVSLLLFIACGGGSGPGGAPLPPGAVGVSLTPTRVALQTGQTQQFSATVTGTTNPAVTWRVTEPLGGQVSSGGLYSAPASAGSFHVVAHSTADTTKSAIATITVTAPVPPSNLAIPSSHPRLLFSTPGLLARARSWFSSTYGLGGFIPEAPVDYAFSYLMTGNAAHAQQAIAWLMAIPPPGQDQLRWDGEQAILVFDWCYDQLTPSQKAATLANWTAYTVAADGYDWGGPAMPGNNYYWGYLRNGLLWGITSHGEASPADFLLNDAIVTRFRGTFQPFALGPIRGGTPAEGSQYGHYQLAYPVVPFLTAQALGLPLYDETPWFKEAVMYLVYATTNAPTRTHAEYAPAYHLWPYADDEQWSLGTSLVDRDAGAFLQVAATRWPAGIGRFARHLLTLANVPRPAYLQALDTREPGDDRDFSALPLDYWAPGIPFLYARTGWDGQATSLLLQLAQVPGSGHQHQDFGSFQLWRAGNWMTRETVTYENTVPGWQGQGQEEGRKGHAHNVVLFEGIGSNSEYYVGPDNYGDGPAGVPRMGRGPDFAFAATDLGKAYRSHASTYLEDGTSRLRDDNAHVKALVREFLWVRPFSTLVVFDRMEAMAFDRQDAEAEHAVIITPRITDAAQVRKTFLLHSEAALRLSPLAGAPAFTSYAAQSGSSLLRCTTVLPTAPATQVVDEGMTEPVNTLPGNLAQFRLEVTTSGSAQSYFLHVLQAGGTSEAEVVPTLREDPTSYTLSLTRGAATARIVFQKGMASTGGSFGYAASGTPILGPLPAGVQGITVTDDGPVWGM